MHDIVSPYNASPHSELRARITGMWEQLRRSPLDPASDEKMGNSDCSYLYVSRREDIEIIRQKVVARREIIGANMPVVVDYLPEGWPNGGSKIPDDRHGLIYLPCDYVVPGGRFNEMYGWDSYWIMRGLIRDGHGGLARGIVENQLYQIEHFGFVLNGNRSYYRRSHPPFIAPMVMEIADTFSDEERREFLARAANLLSKNYSKFWKEQRFMPKTGLFRYGQPNHSLYEPSPEVIKGERDDENQSHYDRLGVLVTQIRNRTQRNRFHDARNQALRPCVWRADGASRESGFDPNMHFGKMGLDTPSYNPVCLNSLLKLHCDIVASICDELGRSSDAGKWKNESARITDAMQAKLCGENGIYTSYHMYDKRLSTRPFLTSAYPLFAGIATQDEAKATRDFIFRHFWTPRGLRAAPRDDDTQWSKIWAPLNDIAARGLRRYGFNGDADTIEAAFLGTVIEAFDRHGALFEKYDPSAEDSAHIANVVGGYHTNEKGFGWTNAVAADIVDRQPGMAPAPERRRVSAVPYGDGAGGVPLAAFAAPGL